MNGLKLYQDIFDIERLYDAKLFFFSQNNLDSHYLMVNKIKNILNLNILLNEVVLNAYIEVENNNKNVGTLGKNADQGNFILNKKPWLKMVLILRVYQVLIILQYQVLRI